MKRYLTLLAVLLIYFYFHTAYAADTAPTDIQQPGSQPGEVGNLETPDKCDNCHGGYDQAVESENHSVVTFAGAALYE